MLLCLLQSYGNFEGKVISDLVAAAKQAGLSVASFVPLGGETLEQVTKRTESFLQDLFR